MSRRAISKRRRASPSGEAPAENDWRVLAGGSGTQLEAQILAREGLRSLAMILEGMKPVQRIPFVLHILEDFDVPTVAAMIGATIGATYKNIERARAHIASLAADDPYLRRFLDGGGEEP